MLLQAWQTPEKKPKGLKSSYGAAEALPLPLPFVERFGFSESPFKIPAADA